MKRMNGWRVALFILLFIAPCVHEAKALPKQQDAQHHHEHHNASDMKGAYEKSVLTGKTIPDINLLSQDGKKIHFYEDLLKEKTVIVSFIYTSCGNVCPMLGENLAKLQGLLGERLGKDIHLISISTDPVTDTPERLKAWAKMFGGKSGWTLITGQKADIEKLTIALAGAVVEKGMHDPIVLLGNQDKGIWKTAFGLASPERLVEMLQGISETPAKP